MLGALIAAFSVSSPPSNAAISGFIANVLGDSFAVPLSAVLRSIHDQREGFLLALLITYVLELVKLEFTINLSEAQFQTIQGALTNISNQPSFVGGIFAKTLKSKSASSLVELVIQDRPVYHNCSVVIDLTFDKDHILYAYSSQFEMMGEEFLYAECSTDEAYYFAMAERRICEVVLAKPTTSGATINSSNHIYLRSRDKTGQVSPVRMQPLSKSDTKRILGHSPHLNSEIKISKALISNEEGLSLIFSPPPAILSRKDNPYVYWVSDRPLYLRTLQVTSSADPEDPAKNISLRSLIPGVQLGSGAQKNHSHQIFKWIVAGQGFVISWKTQ
jgi:hypothetical protein